jgi:hypothetical protein
MLFYILIILFLKKGDWWFHRTPINLECILPFGDISNAIVKLALDFYAFFDALRDWGFMLLF